MQCCFDRKENQKVGPDARFRRRVVETGGDRRCSIPSGIWLPTREYAHDETPSRRFRGAIHGQPQNPGHVSKRWLGSRHIKEAMRLSLRMEMKRHTKNPGVGQTPWFPIGYYHGRPVQVGECT